MESPSEPSTQGTTVDVIEEPVVIRTPDGSADGFLYRSRDGSRKPGVLHLTDIGGIRVSRSSPPGAAASRARSTPVHATAGRYPTTPSTTHPRPNAPSPS